MLTDRTCVDLPNNHEIMMATACEVPNFPSSTLSDAELAEQLACAVESIERRICDGCREPLRDKYFLLVDDAHWHTHCLRCSVCCASLDQRESCFMKNGSVYCKQDYVSEFGIKCSKCKQRIQASDWVRRAKDKVYHLACFVCDACQRQLSTGEEFGLIGEQLLCVRHYRSHLQGDTVEDSEVSCEPKAKRVRYCFVEQQLQILHTNFRSESNPDSESLNRIAHAAGISRRVAQVWFQNARARQRRQQLCGNQTSEHTSSSSRAQWSSGSDSQCSESTSE